MRFQVREEHPKRFQVVDTYFDETLICYAGTREKADAIAEEYNTPLTQDEIDHRPADVEPQGTVRRLLWRAFHRAA